jgi:hypothetical protein
MFTRLILRNEVYRLTIVPRLIFCFGTVQEIHLLLIGTLFRDSTDASPR